MSRRLAFPVILCLLIQASFARHSFAQTFSNRSFTIQSFDGFSTRITLCEKPNCNTLRITADKDTFYLDDWWATDSVRVIDKHFLQIVYAERGGSNLGLTRYLLVAVNNQKLIKTIKVLSKVEWDSFDHAIFQLRPTLLGDDPSRYKLALDIRSDKNTGEKVWTFIRRDRDTLSFDPDSFVFYNRKNPEPIINLGRTYYASQVSYSYILGEWQEQ